jgi:hypothetical protein
MTGSGIAYALSSMLGLELGRIFYLNLRECVIGKILSFLAKIEIIEALTKDCRWFSYLYDVYW